MMDRKNHPQAKGILCSALFEPVDQNGDKQRDADRGDDIPGGQLQHMVHRVQEYSVFGEQLDKVIEADKLCLKTRGPLEDGAIQP